MKIILPKAIVSFVLAYIVVTILAYSLSLGAEAVFDLKTSEELGVNMFDSPAFVMTVPYHLVINLVVWTAFCRMYFGRSSGGTLSKSGAVRLGIFWLALALVVDFTAFVLIPSPFSLTPRQFYVEYQPWISITYAIVLISPLVYLSLSRIRQQF